AALAGAASASVLAGALWATASVAGAAVPAVTVQQLVAAAISAANSERAVTWRGSERAGGQSVVEVARAGRGDGTETLDAHLAGEHLSVQVVLVGGTAYVRSDELGLALVVGLNPTAAKQEAGKWIAVPQSAGTLYTSLANGLTVSSATSILDMVGSLSVAPGPTVHGQRVLAVTEVHHSGLTSVTNTAYIRARGVPLPVEVVQRTTGTQNLAQRVVFSAWGRLPVSKPPQGAVAFKPSWSR
ncbi:MAG: hypothetical protein ACRDZX_07505, partial [Acidimicrobiales bacterium]